MANTSKRIGALVNSGTGGGASSTGFIKNFTIPSWTADGSDYKIVVAEAEHLKGVAPSVDVYELDGTYASVHVSIQVTNAGEITITVPQNPDNRFAGKLIIS